MNVRHSPPSGESVVHKGKEGGKRVAALTLGKTLLTGKILTIRSLVKRMAVKISVRI